MSEGIISVVLFFSMREVKSNTTTLTKSSHHAQYFFFIFLFFFFHWKCEERFSSQPCRNRLKRVRDENCFSLIFQQPLVLVLVLFLFFSTQHSVVAHVIFLFTCCLILLLSTFFFFLSTFNYFSLVFFSNSLAHSLSLTHLFNVLCAMSVEIFFIFTANNILLWYDNVKLYYNNSYRRL